MRRAASSPAGNEAVVEVLERGAFFGEGCLVWQSRRVATAVAVTPCVVIQIEKREMARQLRTNAALARRFLFHVLTRNVRIQGDLLDYLTPTTS